MAGRTTVKKIVSHQCFTAMCKVMEPNNINLDYEALSSDLFTHYAVFNFRTSLSTCGFEFKGYHKLCTRSPKIILLGYCSRLWHCYGTCNVIKELHHMEIEVVDNPLPTQRQFIHSFGLSIAKSRSRLFLLLVTSSLDINDQFSKLCDPISISS